MVGDSQHGSSGSEPERSAAELRRDLAARLDALRNHCELSLRDLVRWCREIERPYPVSSIHEKLNGRTRMNWRFVETIVRACYRSKHPRGEPDLRPWRALFDEAQRVSEVERRRAAAQLPDRVAPRPGTAAVWPHLVGVVPTVADAFQARPGLPSFEDLLRGGHTVVLNGLGGVGKTQLAAAAADRMWQQRAVDLLLWIPATSRESVVTGYAGAAGLIGIDDGSGPDAAAKFLAWLAEPHGHRWLIVLDDLNDPVHLRSLWPPVTAGGSTVVTTRRRDSALTRRGRHVIPVGLFSPAESVQYLRDKLDGDDHQLAGADLLAADLGHLPLALAQAAAYMKDRGLDCATYRSRLSERKLTDVLPERGALPDDYPAEVATTWSLSIEEADRLRPAGLARPLLELAALLGPHDIPADVFSAEATVGYLRDSRSASTTSEDALDAIACLDRLSLVSFDRRAAMVRVHHLLQRAVREATDERHTSALAVVAADALLEIWPEVETDANFIQLLRDNAETLLAQAGDQLWGANLHRVVFLAGNSLAAAGLAEAAVSYWQRLLPTAVERLGADHPETLIVRNNLAWSYGRAGQPERAVSELRELLVDRRRVLGNEHINTLATVHGIAEWLGESGDPRGAVDMSRSLLADYLRVVGPDHRDTLNTRYLLANWLGETESATVAAAEFRALVADYERVQGADHPETFDVRYNLAYWLSRTGAPDEAVSTLQQLLLDSERVLGADHEDTLLIRQRIAALREERYGRA
ncbi:tetratricopeptide repeat protein [Actinoplanes auranticolor]|uniref:DUF7779 domain-containing protein n=1 Tax=Actinoplanes auranticolor TaxID=47988 RepID=A0A919S679_9ACTN|nr:tetratricopeptide repeat protein [Actinoplanes auranticolor]GIM64958.1 hypothetical protein Aau02nite_13800 [Actinoplanes auranticolor]